MSEVKCDTHTCACRELAAPSEFLGHQLQHSLHPFGIQIRLIWIGARRNPWIRKQLEPELHRILARGVRQFVQERVENPDAAIPSWRAKRTGRHSERYHLPN